MYWMSSKSADEQATSQLALSSRIFRELVRTRSVRRLKDIRFLGAIDYALVPNPNGHSGSIRYTRYQHSVGVANLALLYSDFLRLGNADRDLITASALLHDLGHGPLSHSLESVFSQKFGIDHHTATKEIIRGEHFDKEVYHILRSYKLDIDRVIALISGESSEFHNFMAGPINFDTIEGITRSLAYFSGKQVLSEPFEIVRAALERKDERDRNIVDKFWVAKGNVYRHLINSNLGALSDEASKQIMIKNLAVFRKSDFFATETQIFKKIPHLLSVLRERNFDLVFSGLRLMLPVKERKFSIDGSADFFSRQDLYRYKQYRDETVVLAEISPSINASFLNSAVNMDMFNEGD